MKYNESKDQKESKGAKPKHGRPDFMKMGRLGELSLTSMTFLLCFQLSLQGQTISTEKLIAFTPKWKGERFEDGSPKVPNSILERVKYVTIEEAWDVFRQEGYQNSLKRRVDAITHRKPNCGKSFNYNMHANSVCCPKTNYCSR